MSDILISGGQYYLVNSGSGVPQSGAGLGIDLKSLPSVQNMGGLGGLKGGGNSGDSVRSYRIQPSRRARQGVGSGGGRVRGSGSRRRK